MAATITTTVIIDSPPIGRINGKEGLDLALVCAAFDHQVNLIFVDDGVLHLLDNQDEQFFDDKMHDKQLKALEFYGIESIYAESESVSQFGLSPTTLIESVELINRNQINGLCQNSDHTVTFS